MLLQRLAVEVKRLQSSRTGKPNFATAKSEVMELQSLTSHYLTGSKVCKYDLRDYRQILTCTCCDVFIFTQHK